MVSQHLGDLMPADLPAQFHVSPNFHFPNFLPASTALSHPRPYIHPYPSVRLKYLRFARYTPFSLTLTLALGKQCSPFSYPRDLHLDDLHLL